MSSAAALTWFARHEIRLAWREWLAMMTGGRRKRSRAVIGLIVFAVIMHLPAYAVIGRFSDLAMPLDKSSPRSSAPDLSLRCKSQRSCPMARCRVSRC